MSTKKYQKLVERISDIILSETKEDYLLIGENTSGKSSLLLHVMNKCRDRKFYFIDSVNRSFQLELVGDSSEIKSFDYQEIVTRRLEKTIFNKRDSYGVSNIESIYWMNEKRLIEIVSDFFSVKIKIEGSNKKNSPITIPPKFEIIKSGVSFSEEGNHELTIPNGMQAVLRIILELLFFESSMDGNLKEKSIVFIEELDLYLSENYSAKIFNFIRRIFPEFLFVVTTHARGMVIEAEKSNVIAVKENDYEIVRSSENYKLDVEELFINLFHAEEFMLSTNDDEVDKQIRFLLNQRINGNWCTSDEETMNELSLKNLLPHQKFLIDEVKGWQNGL